MGSFFSITTKQNHFCIGRFDWEFIHVWYKFPLAVLLPRTCHWDKTPCRILRFGWAQLWGADDIKAFNLLRGDNGGMAVCRKLLVMIQCGLVCPHKWLDGIWMFPGVEYKFRILLIWRCIFSLKMKDMKICCYNRYGAPRWKLTCSLRVVDSKRRPFGNQQFSASRLTSSPSQAAPHVFLGGSVQTLPIPFLKQQRSSFRSVNDKDWGKHFWYETGMARNELLGGWKTKIAAQNSVGELEVMVRLNRSQCHWSSDVSPHYNPGCMGARHLRRLLMVQKIWPTSWYGKDPNTVYIMIYVHINWWPADFSSL